MARWETRELGMEMHGGLNGDIIKTISTMLMGFPLRRFRWHWNPGRYGFQPMKSRKVTAASSWRKWGFYIMGKLSMNQQLFIATFGCQRVELAWFQLDSAWNWIGPNMSHYFHGKHDYKLFFGGGGPIFRETQSMIDNEFPWLLGHQGIVLRKKIPDIHFVKVVAFKPGSRKSEGGLNCNGPQDGKKKSYPTVHPHKSTMSRDPNYCSSF